MFGWDAGSVEDDFDIFLEPMSGGRKVFVINKQRVERRGIFVIPSGEEKVLWTDKVRWGWQIENED